MEEENVLRIDGEEEINYYYYTCLKCYKDIYPKGSFECLNCDSTKACLTCLKCCEDIKPIGSLKCLNCNSMKWTKIKKQEKIEPCSGCDNCMPVETVKALREMEAFVDQMEEVIPEDNKFWENNRETRVADTVEQLSNFLDALIESERDQVIGYIIDKYM